MKAQTYIDIITKNDCCSIQTAENLTKALRRERILHPGLALRFRPLFGDFDFMPQSWLDGEYRQNVKPYYTGTFSSPGEIMQKAKEATKALYDYEQKLEEEAMRKIEAEQRERACGDCPDDECIGHCTSCAYRTV